MSNRIPVRLGQFQIGSNLTHDVYDRAGKLLLRRGSLLETKVQIEHLQELGFFDPQSGDAEKPPLDADAALAQAGYVPVVRSGPAISVFAEFKAASESLAVILSAKDDGLEAPVRGIAAIIRRCCAVDADASLAYQQFAHPFEHGVRHPVNVAILTTIMLARQKHAEPSIETAAAAALTMNIGALDLHHELFYQADALTAAQRARIHGHPAASCAVLRRRKVTDPLWLEIVAQHHEALDGSGYPAGLAADRICLEAQVVCLADRYCAMIAERAQRDPMVPSQAIKEIHARHGKSIAPALIGVLIGSMGIYPPGTYVQLVNGEIAVVVHRLLDPKHPVVYALCPSSGHPYDAPRKRLTAAQPSHEIGQVLARKSVQVPVDPELLWPPTAIDEAQTSMA